MNILSCFDGMSCGQIALNRASIKYNNYFASEIDEYGMKVTTHNYPNTIHLGDIREINFDNLPKIDLLMGGSPCQSFSFAGKRVGMVTKDNIKILSLKHYLELKNDGFEFQGESYLFWEFIYALEKLKPKYFLLENVMMNEEWESIITSTIGVEPIVICSSNFSAQKRLRNYWTNIPNIKQPKNSNIFLSDVLYDVVDKKYDIKQERVDNLLKYLSKKYVICGKVPTITTELAHSTGKNFYPKALAEIYNVLGHYRRLTPCEVEMLQTVPLNYTDVVSDTERYRMLGNGWTVDVIAYILSYIK